MHFRDLEPRVIDHTIVRISSSSMTQWVQGCNDLIKRAVGIGELCGSCLTPLPCSIRFPVGPDPNPQENDAKFLGFFFFERS